jgi:hypothetical protein
VLSVLPEALGIGAALALIGHSVHVGVIAGAVIDITCIGNGIVIAIGVAVMLKITHFTRCTVCIVFLIGTMLSTTSGASNQTITECVFANSLTYEICATAENTSIPSINTCIGAIARLHTEVISTFYTIVTVNRCTRLAASCCITKFDSVAYEIAITVSIDRCIFTIVSSWIASVQGTLNSIITIRWRTGTALSITYSIEENADDRIAESIITVQSAN